MLFMATHTRQILKKDFFGHETWEDDLRSNHTFLIIAKDKKEADEYAESAIKKVNEYSAANERFVLATDPREINVVNVTHDINAGTSITGIWD